MESFLIWILESSLLILLVLGIRKIFIKKIRYTTIYALWLLVLVRFLIPVNFFSTPISVGTVVSEAISSWMGEAPADQDKTMISVMEQYPNAAGRTSGYSNIKSLQDTKKAAKEEQPFISKKDTNVSDTKESAPLSVWTISDRTRSKIVRGWLAISVIVFLWLILTNVNLNRKMRKKRMLYGKREGVCIYLIPGIKNPCLYGFFRPAIYLPTAYLWNGNRKTEHREEIGQMITHEYVHYCHGDHIWAMFRILLVSFYWFDPFMWLAVSCSKKDAELACDETVIRRLGEKNRFSYGEMLVRLAADTSWGDFRYSMMSMSRKGKEMENRIRAISACKQYSKWVLIPLILAVFVTAGITCSTGLAGEKPVSDLTTENEREAEKPISEIITQEEQGSKSSASRLKAMNTSFGMNGILGTKYADTVSYEDVFFRYIEYFTTAVNTGNTDHMNQVLAEESDVYKQQCSIAKNYYKRGIREEIKDCFISDVKTMGLNKVILESREKINVAYADNTSKLINQTYLYTCEQNGRGWRITQMDEIDESSRN